MATAKIGYPATDNYIAYAAESAFGTAIADNQDFVMLKMTDVNVPSFNPVQYLDEISHQSIPAGWRMSTA